jgi:DNA-binding CsgD family transcriptional regulator
MSYLTAWTLCRLGEVGIASGQLDRAREWLVNSVELTDRGGERHVMAVTLDRLAAVEAASMRFRRALSLVGAADALYSSLDTPRGPWERDALQRWLPAARDRLGTVAADSAWSNGRALAVEQVVALAREREEPVLPATAPSVPDRAHPTSGLTAREQEVVVLLARGLSNRQIADELIISTHTAQRHVENILSKLRLGSRTQVAIWAMGQGLVTATASDAST